MRLIAGLFTTSILTSVLYVLMIVMVSMLVTGTIVIGLVGMLFDITSNGLMKRGL